MVDLNEKDEKITESNSDPSVESFASKEFAPISPAKTPKPIPGSRPSTSRTITRTRSNNGYGCDDPTDSSDENKGGNGLEEGQPEKDEFEVHWEGDHDPLNPKSFSMARKWLIVIIVSASSMCV